MGKNNGGEIKKRRKSNLIKRLGRFCYYCKCQLTTSRSKRNQKNYATLDHRIPKSKTRGWELPNNKVLACRACNEAKADMMPEDFILKIKYILADAKIVCDGLETILDKSQPTRDGADV